MATGNTLSHLNSLKRLIGYVPQDDIIHGELTVYRTLYYVAKLRLSHDVLEREINKIIEEVIDVTGLTGREDVQVAALSGGQRKRVSVAVELLTKPSVIFLDEPTSGLDPTSEERIMTLFRGIADNGHTIILTTHVMENVALFDKIIILMQGKLVFYGTPAEALKYAEVNSFKELYDKLEKPTADKLAQAKERFAEKWKQHYLKTVQYDQYVREPQRYLSSTKRAPAPPRQGVRHKNYLRQFAILSQRYAEVMRCDRVNLILLFGQALIIGGLTWLAVANNRPRDFPYFILSLVPIWFGTSVSAREVIRERAIYNRERMVNLGLWPYVLSKLAVLSLIVSLQCLVLFGTLKLLVLLGLLKLPALWGGGPQLLIMILTGVVGISLGLLVSASIRTSEMATTLVPLLLIPQILFSGLIGVPQGVSKGVGTLMPVTWSFDEMKRLSMWDVKVLEGRDEGAEPAYNNDGRGLYMQTKIEAESAVEGQRGLVPSKSQPKHLNPGPGTSNVPEDKSDYVGFLHPWGSRWLNPVVLLLMFGTLILLTIMILKIQEIMTVGR